MFDVLPRPGELVFFDRSWYNRAVVEPVNGFCTETEYEIFMSQVNPFEQMLTDSGIHLIKLYFSITKDEQAARFNEIKNDPRKRWKITPVEPPRTRTVERLHQVQRAYVRADPHRALPVDHYQCK